MTDWPPVSLFDMLNVDRDRWMYTVCAETDSCYSGSPFGPACADAS